MVSQQWHDEMADLQQRRQHFMDELTRLRRLQAPDCLLNGIRKILRRLNRQIDGLYCVRTVIEG